MKKESKRIKLYLGHVSLDSTLGNYYIDMSPAKIHYEKNIWGGGFDDNGVPMCFVGGGLKYSTVNIAQYGFILLSEWNKYRDDGTLNKLVNCLNILEEKKTIILNTAVWYHDYADLKYGIQPPWASAMAQGEIISFYLRMYQILYKEELLKTAIQAYNFLKIDIQKGGVRRLDDEGNLWFEEYPSQRPSFVLNGFIYTLFGLYDLYRVTGLKSIKEDIDASISSLKKKIHEFDVGYWSKYDLQKNELVRFYYQKNVHVPQLEVLYKLTGEKIFEEYRKKWKTYVNPLNYSFVIIMYRLQPRLNKILRRNERKSN